MNIEVIQQSDADPLRFAVTVTASSGATRHSVTVARSDAERLAGARPPDQLLRAAFRFLLDREPAQSILGQFDLTVIGRYFPEFERELPAYLETV